MSPQPAAPPVAIVGMACVFPGAPDLDAYWHNLREGVDAITTVPPARWDPVYFDPDSAAADRFYCRRGGFVDGLVEVDALGFGIMPVAARGAEPDQLAALQLASRALADAGYGERGDRALPADRTGVILGRGNYIGAGMTRLEQHVRTAEQLVSALRDLVPGIDDKRLSQVKAEFQSRLSAYGPDTAIGLVPNLTASRIANRLDLGGPAYTVDAACASALLAVEQAMTGLQSGRLDLCLAGGVHLSHDVAFWSVFTQLGALSRGQQIRPFDRRADGLLIGEGLGLLVLKRLADARRDDDRIYAVLHGAGVASDGRGATIMTPSLGGQRLALERAWSGCGLDPASIGLVEAHGTGTPVGDAAEVATLRDFFGPAAPGAERATLGSVKSMIGHTMPAAGAAGLIKAALAVHHGLRLPSLHCEEPLPALADTRFQVLPHAAPWADHRRVAAVNAFGFGGINGHVVLANEEEARRARPRPRGDEGLLWLARPDRAALRRALEEGAESGGEGPCRLALVDPTPARRQKALAALDKGGDRRGRDGLWLAERGLLHPTGEGQPGRLCFLFPGVEAQVPPRLPDVARHLGRVLPPDDALTALERHGATVVENGRLLAEALAGLGVRPDLLAGHSTGEWTGMMAAGLIPKGELDAFLATLDPGSLEVPGVVFLSVGAGLDRVEPLVAGIDDLVVSHDNCPHQVVLCGAEGAVAQARVRLQQARVLHHELPFRSGFHAPFFAPFLAPHRQRLATMPLGPATTPLWSATTCAPYPQDLDEVRRLAADHLVQPVRFRALTERLYDAGARVFVQLGMGSLVGFVSDTLHGRPHLAISAQEPQRPGLAQLRRAAAALFVEGAPVDLGRLDPPRPAAPRAPLKLDLGVPLVRLSTPLQLAAAPAPSAPPHLPGDPVLARFEALAREVEHSRDAVAQAWRRSAAPAPPPPRTHTRQLSLSTCPFLADHSLIPQPPGWPVISDWNPVVPMTMTLRMMLEAAAAAVPGAVAVGLEQVRAHRWLAVEPPVEVTVRAEPLAADRVKVTVEGYSEGVVRLAPTWPAPPAAGPDTLSDAQPVGISAREMYDQRWMFHGPAYQAVERLDQVGADGITGLLRALPAEGALLDAAGQLFGLWVMLRVERDKLAMPVKLERIELFGPEPAPGELLRCVVRIRQLAAREVRADLELARGGVTWCRITGWTDWRFETDGRLWPVMQRTEEHLFAESRGDGLAIVDDPGRSTSSRDYLARRFLGAPERAALAALPPREQVPWLLGRIAAKDAVRGLLRQQGGPPLFPVELTVAEGTDGRCEVEGPQAADLRLDVATLGSLAVALAVRGHEPGVAIVPVTGELPEQAARLHAARAALSRARGPVEPGRPPAEVVEVAGDRLCLDGVWVDTLRRGDHILAWTTT
ncbi:polyketide synthase dehydratase domain-containing protein [Myxococcota bacterium]|nr:polyketide synthase dehydratase domain-containing protein [Myxococcota bacterium]